MIVSLDADQQKAAAHTQGTAAVAAAAGSGKTTLLVGRAIRLVEDGAAPESVVTLAFNRNAALTLRERLRESDATRGHEAAMASTFHSFALQCCKLVLPNVNVLGVSAAEDAGKEKRDRGGDAQRLTTWDLAKRALKEIGGDQYGPSRPEYLQGVDVALLMEHEPGIRERLFAAGWPAIANKPAELSAAMGRLKLRNSPPIEALLRFMPTYRRQRTENRVVDFTDMLLGLGNYIRNREPKVMTRLAQIQHLQIDEAQDGNELRWYIAQAVANMGGGRSVMAVGDLRQSIAGFAGAEPALFRGWWDKADAQFALPRNYRSASAIVAAGNAVAKGEPWNVGGDAIAARPDLGVGSVRVEPLGALSIAMEIAADIENGHLKHKEVTVLARTRNALETCAFGLRTKCLKVIVRGGGNVWRSMDARTIIAYLNLADGVVEDLKAAVQALNKPLRYVSGKKMQEWVSEGKFTGTLYREANNYRPAAAVTEVISELGSLVWPLRVERVQEWLLAGMAQDAKENNSAPGDDSDRADLIRNLCSIAAACPSMAGLMMAIAADHKLDPADPDVIELSTIHQSKGDQWKTVYVTGVRNGVFPHAKATDAEDFAEEVRLLYVAVTRPISSLIVDAHEADNGFGDKLAALQAISTSRPAAAAITADEVSPESRLDAAQMLIALQRRETDAKDLTATSETKRVPGERFVEVRWQQFLDLLGPLTFTEDVGRALRAAQRVLNATLRDGTQVLVYTTIPPHAVVGRGNGEDSIKVAVLDAAGQPKSKRLPYAARTVNWRSTLLSRIHEALTEAVA
jgi:DNA helicase-2/ATP-dependent DNA helicase PcrA